MVNGASVGLFTLRLAALVTVFILLSLGPLVSKVKEYQVETIVDTLCTNMLSDKEQLRDISSIGLKTVIGELPPASSGEKMLFNSCDCVKFFFFNSAIYLSVLCRLSFSRQRL